MSSGKTADGFGARSRLKEAVRRAPPPRVRDTVDERADKAERVAHMNHSTSLLGKEPSANPVRAVMTVQRGSAAAVEKRSGMPFTLVVLGVMVLAGGAAYGVSVYAPDLMYGIL